MERMKKRKATMKYYCATGAGSGLGLKTVETLLSRADTTIFALDINIKVCMCSRQDMKTRWRGAPIRGSTDTATVCSLPLRGAVRCGAVPLCGAVPFSIVLQQVRPTTVFTHKTIHRIHPPYHIALFF